jgi:hypothetical protein
MIWAFVNPLNLDNDSTYMHHTILQRDIRPEDPSGITIVENDKIARVVVNYRG